MADTSRTTEHRTAEEIIAAFERGERPAIKAHPAAGCFPLLSDKHLDELVVSIKKSGLLYAIVLTRDGLILDGRNRLRACEPKYNPALKSGEGRQAAKSQPYSRPTKDVA